MTSLMNTTIFYTRNELNDESLQEALLRPSSNEKEESNPYSLLKSPSRSSFSYRFVCFLIGTLLVSYHSHVAVMEFWYNYSALLVQGCRFLCLWALVTGAQDASKNHQVTVCLQIMLIGVCFLVGPAIQTAIFNSNTSEYRVLSLLFRRDWFVCLEMLLIRHILRHQAPTPKDIYGFTNKDCFLSYGDNQAKKSKELVSNYEQSWDDFVL